MGGTHKHKFSWVTTKAPDYFGYKGFHSQAKKVRSINVEELDKLEGNEFNLTKLGYGKLLGRGRITRAVTVTVASCSAQAKEKVEKAGGQVNAV
jgi:large subunit ribosomal protein L15